MINLEEFKKIYIHLKEDYELDNHYFELNFSYDNQLVILFNYEINKFEIFEIDNLIYDKIKIYYNNLENIKSILSKKLSSSPVKFSSNNNFVSGITNFYPSDNDIITVLDLEKGNENKLYFQEYLSLCTFTHDNKYIFLINSENNLKLIELPNLNIIKSFDIPYKFKSKITDIDLNSDNNYIACSLSDDDYINNPQLGFILDLKNLNVSFLGKDYVRNIIGEDLDTSKIMYHKSNKFVFIGLKFSKKIIIINLLTYKIEYMVENVCQGIFCLSNDGNYLAFYESINNIIKILKIN